MSDTPSHSPSLHNKILLGLVLGAAAGLGAKAVLPETTIDRINEYVAGPVGTVFLNLLLMTVVPLVFASLAVGVANLGDLGKLGRMGARTFGFFVLTMSMAVLIGLSLVNLLKPGEGISWEARWKLSKRPIIDEREVGAAAGLFAAPGDGPMLALASLGPDRPAPKAARQEGKFGIDTFVNIVPRNPVQSAARMPPDMLGVIFFALMVGIGLTRIDRDRAKVVVQALEGVNELMVFIIGVAMKLAPYGVFAFLFRATSELGLEVVRILLLYVLVVVAGLAIQMFAVLPVLLRTLARISPVQFFRRSRAIMLTAFSTSSSSATLPTSIKVSQEELGVPPQIAGFVLPLGATMNMNGTALFEGVTVVFLAQVYGVPLDLGQQMIVIVLSVLTAIGAAGVPGGSIPLLMMILGTVGVPPEGLVIILGIDRILDMCRTTLNVMGDVAAATYVTRAEGFPLMDEGVEALRPKEPDEAPGKE